jgi:DNA repair exonuclease SbcCD ATPase subunit
VAAQDPNDLYGLPLERFVPERAALAKSLRSAGERERAAEVAGLRKPSVAAWAVNQLVRTQRRDIAELFDAGDQLQRAQSELLAGRGDGNSLREAADRERALVDQLTNTAQGLLSSEGHELSTTMLERVRDTLQAAALDVDARTQVADGCLVRELHHVGIGAGGLAAGAPTKSSADKQAARVKAARKAVDDAERAAERAERRLDAARQRRDRAAQALEQVEAELAEARREAEQAKRAQAQAQKALGKASR